MVKTSPWPTITQTQEHVPAASSFALKVDCEGCEYAMIPFLQSNAGRIKAMRGELHDDVFLERIHRMQTEIHNAIDFFKGKDPSFVCTWCEKRFPLWAWRTTSTTSSTSSTTSSTTSTSSTGSTTSTTSTISTTSTSSTSSTTTLVLVEYTLDRRNVTDPGAWKVNGVSVRGSKNLQWRGPSRKIPWGSIVSGFDEGDGWVMLRGFDDGHGWVMLGPDSYLPTNIMGEQILFVRNATTAGIHV
eukprot:gnl/TRDRNA2_/TRDRNA2_166785_c0_seq3.p1 gnl/TRDRNA2_/TRDRNA2_166785_c0~~gnl/TRDRNA2_/TRDRNA2_166785_c0_seq3.p1  ORF type:complete len:243 (+),score=28.30 gnl/TRDRNA2_/TRDRNA2_166785_c0_seq3:408-1136(+)